MDRARVRPLLELLVAACAVLTLFTKSPFGELLVRAFAKVTGAHHAEVSLLSFYGSPAGTSSPSFGGMAATAFVPPANGAFRLVQAWPLAAAKSGREEAFLTASGRATLVANGVAPEELATAHGRTDAIARVLPRLADELGSEDAALVALVAGLEEARYAASRAKATTGAATLEAMLPHVDATERKTVTDLAGGTLGMARALTLGWPAPLTAPVTSPFGWRTNPVTGQRQFHGGVDLGLKTGTPVRAALDGVVVRVGEDAVSGRYLVIDHGRGVSSTYCHNESVLKSRGERVSAGEVVADSGATGRVTGPHLHYIVAVASTPVDPVELRALSKQGEASAKLE